jgi:hypothetical protein
VGGCDGQDETRAGTKITAAFTIDQARRASWRRRSDSRFGLADTESGSAATRPGSAIKQDCRSGPPGRSLQHRAERRRRCPY